jgi:hypothetical protein
MNNRAGIVWRSSPTFNEGSRRYRLPFTVGLEL